ELGSLVGSGSVGFVIGDTSAVKAKFGVPDAMVTSMTLGEPIDVIVEALAGTTFPGRVSAIAPAADPQSRVFDVEVTIPNKDGRLRPGMIGTVSVKRRAADAAPVLTVPLTAIVKPNAGDAQYAVLVVEREVARLRPVELGEVLGNGIAVRKGLNAGEQVVV